MTQAHNQDRLIVTDRRPASAPAEQPALAPAKSILISRDGGCWLSRRSHTLCNRSHAGLHGSADGTEAASATQVLPTCTCSY